MYKFFFKRIIDLGVSIFALLLLLPVCLLIACLIKIFIGSPIIFKQARPGLNGKIFNMFKFRTMIDKCDEEGKVLPDKDRLTKFGKFIRTTSLDELPALYNVFNGSMSLVGPRPLLIEYLDLYSEEQARRHDVKPGITGWAQINGRNQINWKEKFELDVWYVNNQSFLLDIKIMLRTLKKVIQREGISHDNHVTMEKFKGNS